MPAIAVPEGMVMDVPALMDALRTPLAAVYEITSVGRFEGVIAAAVVTATVAAAVLTATVDAVVPRVAAAVVVYVVPPSVNVVPLGQ